MSEEINVKMVDFSLLQIGEKFFTSKMMAQDGKAHCVKTETKRLNEGWTNTKSAYGIPSFIKYDARVWVRK